MNTHLSQSRNLGRRFLPQSFGTITFCALAALLPASHDALAATWIGGSGTQLWSASGNWSGTPPNGTYDGALFNAGSSVITLDLPRTVQSIVFDGNAGSFTLGSAGANGGNALSLSTANPVYINMNATLVGSAVKETFNAPIVVQNSFSITNSCWDSSNTLNFAGSMTSNAGAPVTVTLAGNNLGANTISGSIGSSTANAVNIVKSGAGKWVLSGQNTYTGTTTINQGILGITSDANLGAVPASTTGNSIVLNNTAPNWAVLAADGTFTLDSKRGITLGGGVGNGGTILVTGGNTLTYGGVIAGAATGGNNRLMKWGAGTLTLTGANTYTGQTSLVQGTLKLDFSVNGAPTQNIIQTGATTLSMGGDMYGSGIASNATLALVGSSVDNTQTVGTLSTGAGASHINLTAGSGALTLGLGGTLTRKDGSTLDITMSGNSTVTTTASAVNTNGAGTPLLVPIVATLNGSDFVTITNGKLAAFTGYTTNNATSLGAKGAVVDLTTANTSISAGVQVGSLRFNTAQDTTITVGNGSTLGVGTGLPVSGQILVTSTVGAYTSKITGGVIQGNKATLGYDLVVSQNNTSGILEIGSVYTDTYEQKSALTKSGSGTLLLTAANSYTGNSYINEGKVILAGNVVASSTQTLTLTNNSNQITVNDASNLFVGQRVVGTGLNGSTTGQYITAISGNVITLSDTAKVSGQSTLTFLGGGGLGIGKTVTQVATSVQVANGATLQIGNGGTTGGLAAGQAITNYGIVALNRSDDFTFSNVITKNPIYPLGMGALTKLGTNKVTVDVNNSYEGVTTIGGGILSVGSAGATSTTTVNGTVASGTNVITGISTAGLVVGQGVAGSGINAGTVITAIDSSANTVTLSLATSAAGSSFTFNAAAPLANGGVNSAIGMSSSDAANLVLDSGTLQYTGAATANTDRLFTVTAKGGGLDSSSSSNAAVNFTNTGAVAMSGNGARTLTLSGSSTGNNTLTAKVGDGTGGATSLTKKDGGKWIVSGANTYSGTTTVEAGKLAVALSGSISNVLVLGKSGVSTGTLDVTAKGATYSQKDISGSGTIDIGSGKVTATGAVAPGFGIGELDITGDFTLASTAATSMEIGDSSSFDLIKATGLLTYGGSLAVTEINGFSLDVTGSYKLFAASSYSSATDFSSITVKGVSLTDALGTWTGSSGNAGYKFTESTGVLEVTAVPEPSSWMIMVAGMSMLGFFQRMRVRANA